MNCSTAVPSRNLFSITVVDDADLEGVFMSGDVLVIHCSGKCNSLFVSHVMDCIAIRSVHRRSVMSSPMASGG